MKRGHSHPASLPKAPWLSRFELGRWCRERKAIWLGVLLVLATFAAYGPVYTAGFIWDDDDYVTQNACLRDVDGLNRIWFDPSATPQYYPLIYSTFWLEYHLWGLQPMGFHLVNVLLHIAGGLLLWRILTILQLPGAWLAAAVFTLHPVQVESVAWITERKNVLSTVFYFLAALAYLKFLGLDTAVSGTKNRWRFYCLALSLFIAALWCKTVTCSLPAALLLVLWWKKPCLRWRDVLPLAPFFLIGLGMGLLTAWLEKNHVGANGGDWSLTLTERCLIAGRALFFYAAKLLWPAELVFIYPRWHVDVALWWQWLFPLGAVFSLIGLWLTRRITGKGSLVAVLFFCGTLFPALGFIDIYPMQFSFVADHFQYLAGIGIIVIAVSATSRFFERRPGFGRWPTTLAALLLLMLGIRTWQQCHIYKDLETLWSDTLSKNPRCWMAHTNLGRIRAHEGKLDEAESHYLAAIAVHPENEVLLYNYGNLLTRMRRYDEAYNHISHALRIAPDYAEAHNNLGVILFQEHRFDKAAVEYKQAIIYKPGYADAYFNLSIALANEQKNEEAIAAAQQALSLKPDSELFRKQLDALRSQERPKP